MSHSKRPLTLIPGWARGEKKVCPYAYLRHPRHAVAILRGRKSKLYDFLDPVMDDIAAELQGEVAEHDRELITDEVQRQRLKDGVYIFTDVGKKKTKEIAMEIIEVIFLEVQIKNSSNINGR